MADRTQIRMAAVGALATLHEEELVAMSDKIIEYIFLFNDTGSSLLEGDWQQAPGDPLYARMLDSASACTDALQALRDINAADGRQAIRDAAADAVDALNYEERDALIMAILHRIYVSDDITGDSLASEWYEGRTNINVAFWTAPLAIRDIYNALFALP